MGKKKKTIPTNIFDPYHVYLWAGDKLSTVQKYGAAIRMYREAEDNANDNKEMLPIYGKRSLAYLHMGNIKSAESDAVEGLQLDPENTPLLQARGEVLLEKNLFEDALGTYHRGHCLKPKPPRFLHGIYATTGVIMDTLGPRAGNLMSNNRLGNVVRKMKLKQINIAYPPPPDIEIAKRRKLRKIERIKDAYTEIYLGKAAKDYNLLSELLNSGKLYLGNKKQNVKLKKILSSALSRLEEKEGALWRRKPLYSREMDVIPKATLKVMQEKARLKKKEAELYILSQLNAVETAISSKDYVGSFKMGDALRHYLFEQSEKLITFKREALNLVIQVLGDMFISMKKIFLNWDAQKNDERIMYIMGMTRPYKLVHEIYRDGGFHPAIRNIDDFIARKLADLDHTVDALESAYLCHEIAAAYSFKGRPLIMGTYSKRGIIASKKARNFVWFLNCMFMLARSQLQAHHIRDGQLTLAGLKKAAREFQYVNAYHFAERAMALSSHEKPGVLIEVDFEDLRYNTIIDIMATKDLKIAARKQMQKILNRPPHKRFSLAKGPRPDKKINVNEEVVKKEDDSEGTEFEKMYVDGVLIDKRDPDDLERLEEECKSVVMFQTDVFRPDFIQEKDNSFLE